MKALTLQLDHDSSKPLYVQLYEYLRDGISSGDIAAGEKLPSLRSLSDTLGISITTSRLAYDQLLVEGYIESRQRSGYYAGSFSGAGGSREETGRQNVDTSDDDIFRDPEDVYIHDLSSFDFVKWKKCMSNVLTNFQDRLLSGADPQGEPALRHEIARYVYTSRGVSCSPDQIVIGAGSQTLMNHLAVIMRRLGIGHMSTEDPGYAPIQKIFSDFGFPITKIPVADDGIEIEKLPSNIRSAVYVSPSNQFPTGSVMPVNRRYQLLKWAEENDSLIIEDDYNSELRYFGQPVPALDSLDRHGSTVYLGSFSSTLFAAVRISYMILPKQLMNVFNEIKNDYDQTCSKTEQLTLALFMRDGYYARNIRKLRALCSRKLRTAADAFEKYSNGKIEPLNTKSGINITIRIKTDMSPEKLCSEARGLALQMVPVQDLSDSGSAVLVFYYNQIPEDRLSSEIEQVIKKWKIS